MNKKTIALTQTQYEEIISTIRSGFLNHKPNEQIATALIIEANLGLRVSDIVRLRLKDIIRDGTRYRLSIVEKKTQKQRSFTVPDEIYQYIRLYCIDNEIKSHDVIFPLSARAIQKHLQKTSDYLGYSGIGTHSFRKFFATQIYQNNNYNIILVQQLLQHSSPTVTQAYIGLGSQELENALQKNLNLL